MPDQFLGYWKSNHKYGHYFDISSDGTMEFRTFNAAHELFETVDYKVIHVEKPFVYLVVKETDHYVSTRTNPRWQYHRYRFKRDLDIEHNFHRLFSSTQHCDLSEQDWDLPAAMHWERLQNGTCLDYEGDSIFRGQTTYNYKGHSRPVP